MAFNSIELPDIDLEERSRNRTLLQFRNSFVFQNVLCAFTGEAERFKDAIQGVIEGRAPLTAVGEQLDGIARIVGQDRIVFDYSLINYFAPDDSESVIDRTPVWVEGAPTTENLVVDDAWFRQLIESRIARNFSFFGSVAECKEVIRLAFGVNVGFMRVGIMQVSVIVPYDVPAYVKNFLSYFATLSNSDDESFMPYPQTLEINSIILIPSQPFAPDTVNGADIGRAAVGYGYS